jgi:hypothetical protein
VHALIQEDQTAGVVHLLGEFKVVFEVETGDLGMRAPDQTAYLHPFSRKIGEHIGEFLAVDELLVGVASPVREMNRVSRLHLAEPRMQTREVRPTMEQQLNVIALGIRRHDVAPKI